MKMSQAAHRQRKDMVMLVGGLIIVVLCVGIVGFLIYQGLKSGQTIPEYYLTIFTSIATLIIGYTLGSHKNE